MNFNCVEEILLRLIVKCDLGPGEWRGPHTPSKGGVFRRGLYRPNEFILELVHLSLNSSLAPYWLKDLDQDSSILSYKMGMIKNLPPPKAEIRSHVIMHRERSR